MAVKHNGTFSLAFYSRVHTDMKKFVLFVFAGIPLLALWNYMTGRFICYFTGSHVLNNVVYFGGAIGQCALCCILLSMSRPTHHKTALRYVILSYPQDAVSVFLYFPGKCHSSAHYEASIEERSIY